MELDGITLSDALVWSNEHSYSQVAQTQDRGVTGAIIIQEALKQYGREIDLTGTSESNWISKATLDALYAKEALLDHDMPVTLPDGQTFTVRFNRNGGPAIQAERVSLYQGIPTATTLYTITRLRLITIEPEEEP